MIARPAARRRHLISLLLLFALADVAWGPAGCDGCSPVTTR